MNGAAWHKEMAVYQIWTRSFCDGNGDGIGDLYGVLSKLDYIRSLNVDAIWFSPIYPSPNADYGYDISDYCDIHPDFGTLDTFRQVLEEAHARGMKVFMDLVINHTSDEHPWFREASRSVDSPYHNYYIWREGKNLHGHRLPPNNWTSLFEGGAWEYVEAVDEFYLHLFARKQPDLNMANPAVRKEIKKIMRFWLDMGVDGFREDVINYIGKDPRMPDAYPKLPLANGLRYFLNQPQTYDYLSEFKRDVLSDYDCFTVGECAMMPVKLALQYIGEGEGQVLDEIITFDHMNADSFLVDALRRPFDLRRLKKAMSDWQTGTEGRAWHALYIENHDHPRAVSRFGSERYRTESGKMLAAMYILQRGTPFIYQGQELGMSNISLPELAMYKDVSMQNTVRIASKFLPKKTVEKVARESTRDNARTPVQWSADRNAGFSEAEPWFPINGNYRSVNAAAQEEDPNSLLNFYRKLLEFRRSTPTAIYGAYREYLPESRDLYVYERAYEGRKLLVICSFTSRPVRFDAPEGFRLEEGEEVLSNYDFHVIISNGFTTRPYEMRVYAFG